MHDAPPEVFAANIDGTQRAPADRRPRATSPRRSRSARPSACSGRARRHGDRRLADRTRSATTPRRGRTRSSSSSHGGPHAATGYSFDFKKQFFAANGYFVFDTNFRSSTGYGDAFKWATWGEWGKKDGEDVVSGIDFVLKRYPIDPKRVGHTGHSYGGFMTNWLITQYPDRFAAAITGAGITNWMSDYGTADIYRTKETEFFGTPWDAAARERMIKQSPLTYAGNVKTPTLFVHGEVDQRVPYEEGEQMYFALKRRGVPAKMIQYAGQPHGIAGHWNNVHRMLNELAWWNQYLRPGPAATTHSKRSEGEITIRRHGLVGLSLSIAITVVAMLAAGSPAAPEGSQVRAAHAALQVRAGFARAAGRPPSGGLRGLQLQAKARPNGRALQRGVSRANLQRAEPANLRTFWRSAEPISPSSSAQAMHAPASARPIAISRRGHSRVGPASRAAASRCSLPSRTRHASGCCGFRSVPICSARCGGLSSTVSPAPLFTCCPTSMRSAPTSRAGREQDPLWRDTIVFLTCVHEIGHALGLPHTAAERDIMYSFGYGGDIVEYFMRYRRKLKARSDMQTVSGLSDADRRQLRALHPSP